MNTSIAASVVAGAMTAFATATTHPEPFAFLAAPINLAEREHTRLQAGEDVVKVLPAGDREVAVVAATRTTAPPERLIAWSRDIVSLRRSRYVPLIAKFSDPPRIEDVHALILEDAELEDLRRCRPGTCGLKLSAHEMARLRQAGVDTDWKSAVQEEFRRVVLNRVESYLTHGDVGLPPYDDHAPGVVPAAEMASLAHEIGLVSPRLPGVAEYIQAYPRLEHPAVVGSLVYWSMEIFGGKPIVSVTHVTLLSMDLGGRPGALAISKQLFATHYRTGALSVTAISESESGRYLVYAQRSHVDVLRGMFGGVLRRMLEGRIRDEAPAFLNTTRDRLEGGDPP